MLHLGNRLESLKHQFCISNMLGHLFSCNRSPNSNEDNCRLCFQLFVNDGSDFVSSIRYHVTLIFSRNNVFNKDLELLFTKADLRHFSLDIMYHSEIHCTLVDSKQSSCIFWLQNNHVNLLLNCPKFGLEY